MKERSYYEEKNIENIKKLRELEKELPPYTTTFFRGIEPYTASRTRIAYAIDLKVFFEFIRDANPIYRNTFLFSRHSILNPKIFSQVSATLSSDRPDSSVFRIR